MRTIEDVRRSISHYLSLAFPDYDHYMGRYEGSVTRPCIVLRAVGPTLHPRSPWHTQESVQPFTVNLLPLVLESPEESETHMSKETEKLRRVFEQGVRLGPDNWVGHMDRIPLWDWDEVGLDEPLPDDREPDGHLWVLDWNTNPLQDENDHRAWRVTATIRVRWLRLGRLAEPDPVLVRYPVRLTRGPGMN